MAVQPQVLNRTRSPNAREAVWNSNYIAKSGNHPKLRLISDIEGPPKIGVPHMSNAYDDPLILVSVRARIGEGLREHYHVPEKLSPELLAVAGRFGKSRTLIGTLDAIEGNYLKRYSSIASGSD